ncbi:MAG: hypothetical protein KGI08_03305, partial [Thaumarchaeota archaeon]|nr:hypothetical protein [Nitrososphaerota archaeon]
TSLKKKFQIKSWKYPQWFWVYVYNDIKDLRKESDAYDKMIGALRDGENDDILGICHTYTREDTVTHTISKNIGIIRLSVPYLPTHIVSHEVFHAAMGLYRFHHKDKANFGKHVTPKEEELAHLYGEMFQEMTHKLYKYKFWN